MKPIPPGHISPWLATILRPIHRLLMRFYFRVEIKGRENLPDRVPMVLAPTHRSMWDSLILTHLTKRPVRYLASRNNFTGLQGWVMRRMGCIAINVERPSHHALRLCQTLIESARPVVVFPEATIYYYPPHEVHTPLKHGVAWLALRSVRSAEGVAPVVVPIRLVYSDLRLRFRTRIEIIVGSPIDPRDYRDLSPRAARIALPDDLCRRLGDMANDSIRERYPAVEFLAECAARASEHP